MDYEKKYKESLEKAKKLYGKYCINNVLEDLFPELAESEDERIRKEIISALKWANDDGVYNKHLAWLEKQGTSYTKRDVDDAYLKGINDAKQEVEKQYKADYQIRKDIATFIFNYRGDIKDRAKWMNYLGVKVYVFENEDEKKRNSL